MSYPLAFLTWLKMLHLAATTKLILQSGLSREIEVSFSLRQGDCISGDLYCITQEPLLRMLRRKLEGLIVFNFREVDTSYLDDIEILSEDEQDLVRFNRIMQRFESQSGAMLSRSKKSRVMGLGLWQERTVWPEEVWWLQSVKEMRVLGITLCSQYINTLQHTWEQVFRGFQKTLFAWGSKALVTLQQRVTVLQTFAMSKLWYTAQVLPLPASVLKKFESASSSFIFRGRPERLKLAELQNPAEKGGLGLMCVATKAECLLLRQSLRILQRPASNCYLHLGHWLGFALQDTFPQLVACCPSLLPRFPLHKAMLEALEEGLLREEYDPKDLESASSKKIYQSRAADVIPPPKVEDKYPHVDFRGLVFPRLRYNILEAEPKDILYCLVHNIQPTRERLFEQKRAGNAFCPLPQCQDKVQDREHLFCSCSLVCEAWVWLRTKLLQLLPSTIGAVGTTNEEFLLLQFPKDSKDKEVVWVLGNFCDIVLKIVVVKKRKLTADRVAGMLRSRLLALQDRAVVQPVINNM